MKKHSFYSNIIDLKEELKYYPKAIELYKLAKINDTLEIFNGVFVHTTKG